MLIPLIAIPVSLVGTFTFMGLMGFSINTLTLFGLVLAIGLVVDDAIIIVENSYRLIETGKYVDMKSAVTQAMKEVSGALSLSSWPCSSRPHLLAGSRECFTSNSP